MKTIALAAFALSFAFLPTSFAQADGDSALSSSSLPTTDGDPVKDELSTSFLLRRCRITPDCPAPMHCTKKSLSQVYGICR